MANTPQEFAAEKLRQRTAKYLERKDLSWAIVVSEIRDSLKRISNDEDPVYRYALFVEVIRTALSSGAAVATVQTNKEINNAQKLLEEWHATDIEPPDELAEIIAEVARGQEMVSDLRGTLSDYLAGLANYVRSPRYEPDQPLGKAMMESAREDFSEQATRQDVLRKVVASMIGNEKPSAEVTAKHKKALLNMLATDVDRIYSEVLIEQSIKTHGNPYWYDSDSDTE